MNNLNLRHSLVLASVLLLAGFASGCAMVVAPLSASDTASTDERHGLLFGSMRFARHGTDQVKKFTQPLEMRWMLEEQAKGKQSVLADLPTDGPFALKLPAGFEHVKSIGFDDGEMAMLDTTLQVQPRGCTSLGLWELKSEKQFPGWITTHVFENLEPIQDEFHHIIATQECPSLAAPLLNSWMRSKLVFQNEAWGLHDQYDEQYVD